LNGSDRTKNERTPTCPSSSDGTLVISPCPRNSPSPANTASDFRNHPQKRHSPLDSHVVNDAPQHRRNHSSEEDEDTMNLLSSSASESRHYPLSLDAPEVLQFVDSHLSMRFQHPVADTLETEAQSLLRNFDRLHSVLYSELSGELKKLRALEGISARTHGRDRIEKGTSSFGFTRCTNLNAAILLAERVQPFTSFHSVSALQWQLQATYSLSYRSHDRESFHPRSLL
uniref:VPS37 C-terminal domain-containing protein n=1 Tax=Hydatigena taeniaeformis TaxID=6205 RepID=A0A0R3XBR8_HYDTA